MPLTYAHPAAVIPLHKLIRKRYRNLSALVIGSMAPDLPYFVPFETIERDITHSISGVFIFSLPLGLICYFLFHGFIKQPVINLLPSPLMLRLNGGQKETALPFFSRLCIISVSLITGATTHLVWDSFTHATGEMVRIWPVLSYNLFTLHGYDILVFKVLQHFSTLAGLGLLFYWTAKWYQKAEVGMPSRSILSGKVRLLTLTLILLVSAIVAFWFGLQAMIYTTEGFPLKIFLGQAAINGTTAFSLLMCLYCLLWHFLQRQRME